MDERAGNNNAQSSDLGGGDAVNQMHGRGGTGLSIAGVEQRKENRSWVHFWSCCVQMPEEPSGRGQIQLLSGLKLLQLRALFKRTNRNSKDQLRYRSLGGASARKGPEV